MSDSKSNVNMVEGATVQTHGNNNDNIREQPPNDTAPAAPPQPMAAGAQYAKGDYDISFLSSGGSVDTPSPSTASATPPPMAGKHARSPSGPRRHSPLSRAVHRRVDMPEGDHGALLRALQQQQEYDHDFADQLKGAIESVHERTMEHDTGIARWRRWSEDSAKKLLEMAHHVHQQ